MTSKYQNAIPRHWLRRLAIAPRRTVTWTIAGLLGAAALSTAANQAKALDPKTTDPRQIAKAMEARDEGDHAQATVTLTLIDASGRKRVRKLRQQRIKFAGGHKTIMFFESPADVRNTGLLSIDYDDGSRDDDQWLYLPSLHKSTRIASVNKSDSFMGTDLTYADMTKTDTSAYEYKLLDGDAKVDGEACWLIEARPKTDKEKRETGYLKTQVWVSKDKLLPVQTKAWVLEGKKLKYMKASEFTKIDGVWIAKRLAVRTVRNNKVESETLMEMANLKFNQPSITDDQFTERRLEQGL